MYVEATNTYLVIVKNKMFSNAGTVYKDGSLPTVLEGCIS